jgi:hypothetical protein
MINLANTILTVSNSVLDSIDMSHYPSKYQQTHSKGSSEYYNWISGKEHYRLLTYISNELSDHVLIDIGTLNGWSSIALGTNKTNKVISFDILQQKDVLSIKEPNISYVIGNILEKENDDLLVSSPFILLDTYHDGGFEQQCIDKLVNIKYKGVLMLDDIYLTEGMRLLWDSISLPKHDITHIGHLSGTGIVLFN